MRYLNSDKMKYLLLLFQISISLTLYSQTVNSSHCWQVTDEKTNQYFNNLFGVVTGNDPNLTEIKLDFAEGNMVYVTGIQVIREYCRLKFHLADSSIKNFTNQFIRKE